MWVEFRPKLIDTLKGYNREKLAADLTAGIVVGIVALPLSIALAIASGVNPERGLITAVIGGFLISMLGGSRVQIAGPTGAFIVILYGIVAEFGVEGLLLATMMAGVMTVLFGVLKIGTLIQFMPYPIIVGFTSGIALIILFSQVKDFFGMGGGDVPADTIDKLVFYAQHATTLNPYALLLGMATILITVYGGRISSKIPGSLLAIIGSVVVVNVFNLPVETIGSKFGELSAQIPSPELPQMSFSSFRVLLLPAFSIAMLGSIESLLSAMVADGATGYRHRPNTELIANGVANIVVPLFGGIPACGAIARTMTNIRNGGLTPVAGMMHAVVVLMILLFFGKWARLIPMPALAGILFVVAYNMSEWRSFKGMFRNTKSDLSVMLVTFLLTVLVDITVAIQFGVVLAAFLFVRRVVETSEVALLTTEVKGETSHISDDQEHLEIPEGVEVFQVRGPFFFGVVNKFYEADKQLGQKPRVRIIRMRLVPFIDSTGIKNLESFIHKTRKSNIPIIISGLQEKTHHALERAGVLAMVGNENICPEIHTALQRARQIMEKDIG
ncbi:MAG: SulP family inorganic anion transporter [Bacteroidales bacterium]